jgi:hypothetical protein
MEVSGQRHAPAALPPGKRPRYPLDRRLDGPQSRSGRGGEEKNSQPPPGIDYYYYWLPHTNVTEWSTQMQVFRYGMLDPVFWSPLSENERFSNTPNCSNTDVLTAMWCDSQYLGGRISDAAKLMPTAFQTGTKNAWNYLVDDRHLTSQTHGAMRGAIMRYWKRGEAYLNI